MLTIVYAMSQAKIVSSSGQIQAPRASSLVLPSSDSDLTEQDRVYREIFDAAMDRRLLPGTRLTEARLCAIFGCSRATVRAALARLAHDRLVVIEPNRGASVWQASAKEIRDVFAMRRALECLVIDAIIALEARRTRLQPLYEMVAQEEQSFANGDRVSWLRLSNAFHVELARILDNQVFTETLAALCARTTLMIALGGSQSDSTCSYAEHAQILEDLARGDARGARALMEHHLLDCEQRITATDGAGVDPWSAFSVNYRSSK